MFDLGEQWTVGICDWCYFTHFHNRVIERTPDDMFVDGQWNTVDHRPTKELIAQYDKINQEVANEMTTDVVLLTTADLDRGQLCLKCLEYLIDSYYAYKQEEQ